MSRERTRRAAAYPAENGVDFLFGRKARGNYGIGKTAEIAADGIFPGGRVADKEKGDDEKDVDSPPEDTKDDNPVGK